MRKVNMILGAAALLFCGYLIGAAAIPLTASSSGKIPEKAKPHEGEKDEILAAAAEIKEWKETSAIADLGQVEKQEFTEKKTGQAKPEIQPFNSAATRTSNAGASLAAKTSEMYRNRRRQKLFHRVMVQAAQEKQQREDLDYYQRVTLPQQQAAAQQSFDNSMNAIDRMNQQEMIDIQRQRNFLLQQQLWNDQNYYWTQPLPYHHH